MINSDDIVSGIGCANSHLPNSSSTITSSSAKVSSFRHRRNASGSIHKSFFDIGSFLGEKVFFCAMINEACTRLILEPGHFLFIILTELYTL